MAAEHKKTQTEPKKTPNEYEQAQAVVNKIQEQFKAISTALTNFTAILNPLKERGTELVPLQDDKSSRAEIFVEQLAFLTDPGREIEFSPSGYLKISAEVDKAFAAYDHLFNLMFLEETQGETQLAGLSDYDKIANRLSIKKAGEKPELSKLQRSLFDLRNTTTETFLRVKLDKMYLEFLTLNLIFAAKPLEKLARIEAEFIELEGSKAFKYLFGNSHPTQIVTPEGLIKPEEGQHYISGRYNISESFMEEGYDGPPVLILISPYREEFLNQAIKLLAAVRIEKTRLLEARSQIAADNTVSSSPATLAAAPAPSSLDSVPPVRSQITADNTTSSSPATLAATPIPPSLDLAPPAATRVSPAAMAMLTSSMSSLSNSSTAASSSDLSKAPAPTPDSPPTNAP